MKQLAERLVAEVERILLATGTDKVHLVGHSLGGVVIAQAIADDRLTGESTRSSPSARHSGERPGRMCCRLSKSSGKCRPAHHCCADSPPPHCPTESDGCH